MLEKEKFCTSYSRSDTELTYLCTRNTCNGNNRNRVALKITRWSRFLRFRMYLNAHLSNLRIINPLCAGNWLRTITSDPAVHNNSSPFLLNSSATTYRWIKRQIDCLLCLFRFHSKTFFRILEAERKYRNFSTRGEVFACIRHQRIYYARVYLAVKVKQRNAGRELTMIQNIFLSTGWLSRYVRSQRSVQN